MVDELELTSSKSILDVGCGPGRHSLELARRGFRVTGIDISETFIDIARSRAEHEGLTNAKFFVVDARDHDAMVSAVGQVDRVVCLCQGSGGRLALSAFNAYFSVRHHHEADFDADRGISHERTVIKDPAGLGKEVSLWTGCYTPRELRLLLVKHGFRDPSVYGVEPG
ncbi:MAG: hypothetical protein RLZZ449_1091, partial [Actinomycetota bacterium]